MTTKASTKYKVSKKAIKRYLADHDLTKKQLAQITDEELCEIAEELRMRDRCEGFEDCTECQELSMKLFGDKWGLCRLDDQDAGLWKALADLIDRPVYRPVIPNAMEGDVFCPQCGAPIGEYGVPNYCHSCGVAIRNGH